MFIPITCGSQGTVSHLYKHLCGELTGECHQKRRSREKDPTDFPASSMKCPWKIPIPPKEPHFLSVGCHGENLLICSILSGTVSFRSFYCSSLIYLVSNYRLGRQPLSRNPWRLHRWFSGFPTGYMAQFQEFFLLPFSLSLCEFFLCKWIYIGHLNTIGVCLDLWIKNNKLEYTGTHWKFTVIEGTKKVTVNQVIL